MSEQIGNSRYVVIGERGDGRRWAIGTGESRIRANELLDAGRSIDGVYWKGVRVHDRHTEGLTPPGGWSEIGRMDEERARA